MKENIEEEIVEEEPVIIEVDEVTLPESYKCSGAKFYFKKCEIMPDGSTQLSILSYAKKPYDSFWFVLHFPDGTEKIHGFTQQIAKGDNVVTTFDFPILKLIEQYGNFNKVEVDPQMMNELGQPVICRNLRVVFSPDINCR